MNSPNVWDDILGRVETKINRHSFFTWFKPTTFVRDDGPTLTVKVPNPLFRDWLTKHYSGVLGEAIAEVQREGLTLVFVSDSRPEAGSSIEAAPPISLSEGETPPPAETLPPADGQRAVGLNLRYTFDTFVVGPSNQFAEAASRAVAESPVSYTHLTLPTKRIV